MKEGHQAVFGGLLSFFSALGKISDQNAELCMSWLREAILIKKKSKICDFTCD
jgi:hypothetical protein